MADLPQIDQMNLGDLSKKINILKKIHQISTEILAIQKGGKNEAQGYKYIAESQITEIFKPILDKHQVLFFHSSSIVSTERSPSDKQIVTSVIVDYAFIDIETGESIQGFVGGQGADSGDKGVYKAVTGAIKYIFMKNFLIPTGDDPENDRKGKSKASVYDTPPFDDND